MRPRIGLHTQFEQLTSPEPNSGCLLWLGYPDEQGYGKLHHACRFYRATHIAWLLAGNVAPEKGQLLMHTCDNPACVEVRHLRIGTNVDNMRDMQIKARGTRNKNGLPRGVRITAAGTFQAVAYLGRAVHLGTYATIEAASAVVEAAILRRGSDGATEPPP